MRSIGYSLVALTLFTATDVTFAQRDAGAKIRGESYNFYGRSAGSAMRSAREYSGYYRDYVQSTPQQVNPEIAKEAADSIGMWIEKAQKHMASMRRVAEKHKDKETLASLDVIDKHLTDASKSHAEMKDTCLKESIDSKMTLDCCKPLYDHLAKAEAEHDKLMKRIGGAKPSSSNK